jgi:hypothetical protein
MSAIPRRARCLHPGCLAAPTVGVLCSHHASPRHAPVRATVLPAAVVLDAAGASLAAEGDTRDEDQLPPPWRCDPRVVAIHRARLALAIASAAQAVVNRARRVAVDGGELDGLNDALEDLETAARDGLPWMRAARGER